MLQEPNISKVLINHEGSLQRKIPHSPNNWRKHCSTKCHRNIVLYNMFPWQQMNIIYNSTAWVMQTESWTHWGPSTSHTTSAGQQVICSWMGRGSDHVPLDCCHSECNLLKSCLPWPPHTRLGWVISVGRGCCCVHAACQVSIHYDSVSERKALRTWVVHSQCRFCPRSLEVLRGGGANMY